MKLFLFFLIFCGSVFSKPLEFTKSEFEIIENSPNKISIINRLTNLQDLLNEALAYDTFKQLNRVNSYVNKILPSRDIDSGKQTDSWATPKEFLISGKGDCEDYAILKYFSLLEIGIPKDKLWFGVVKTKNLVEHHMVLFYFDSDKTPPQVLDNLSWKILPLDKRSDLTTLFAFNEFEARTLKEGVFNLKINYPKDINSKFKTLLKKINNNIK
jgi:predicted transglutaminase-like cysteine proteinase